VLEGDIRSCFDRIGHAWLEAHVPLPRVLLRKWLGCGYLENNVRHETTEGTPQGGIISPLLANVYLHYVLDVWFAEEVQPRLRGRAFLIRYADDLVMGFACEEDARRVLDVLPKRFGKYGLTLHPDKTRVVAFRPPAASGKDGPGEKGSPGTFDLLGFTHGGGRSRQGKWIVKRRTATSRLQRALRRIADWCRWNRHRPLREQQQTLGQKLRGHFGYFGVTGNGGALHRFRDGVVRLWRKWLSRRSRGAPSTWDRFQLLLGHYPLPAAVVVHSVCRQGANP